MHILRVAEGFEKCSQNEDRVGYLPLESNTSNSSNTAYLKTKVDMLFFTIKHCQCFTLTKGHGAVVTVGSMRMAMFLFCLFLFFVVVLRFDPTLFPPFSLSISTFSFAFSCVFHKMGNFSRA